MLYVDISSLEATLYYCRVSVVTILLRMLLRDDKGP
jgi:hypothetical protein